MVILIVLHVIILLTVKKEMKEMEFHLIAYAKNFFMITNRMKNVNLVTHYGNCKKIIYLLYKV